MSLRRPAGQPLPVTRIHDDPRLERLTRETEGIARRVQDFGIIVTPDVPLITALSFGSAGGTSPAGLVLRLSEGTWDFGSSVFTIDKSNVTIIGAPGGRTIFRRSSSVSNVSRQPLLAVTGNNVRLLGIRFNEAVQTNAAAIEVSGTASRAVIADCTFDDCYQAVALLNTASNALIRNNYVVAARHTTRTMELQGTNVRCQFVGNQFESTATTCIYAGNLATDCTFDNNVAASGSTNVVSYPGGLRHADSGNVGTVQNRATLSRRDLSAGITGEDGDVLKSGTATVPAATTSVAVTFTTAMSTSSYRIQLTFAASPGAAISLYWTNKATTGFTINASAAPAGDTAVEWIAYRYA